MRRLAAAILAAGLCGAASAGTSPLSGAWSGEMRQIETNGEMSYPMTLSISGTAAVATYPTLNCSGAWTKVAEKNGYIVYSEHVTNQKGASCLDGLVMVTLDQGKVFVGWFTAYEGAPTVATAVLARAAK